MIQLLMKTSFQKTNLDTENIRLTKVPEKNLLKVQNLLSSNSQKLAETFWTNVIFALKYRLDS